jgi:dTDP-4-dehydrorhamnose reductase
MDDPLYKPLPETIDDEATLNEVMTRPSPALLDWVENISNPLLILGAGGKMGPSLAVLAKRAAQESGVPLRVLAVSRYSDANVPRWLEEEGVETISFNLLNHKDYDSLPDAQDVIYMVGLKFGTAQNPAMTWVMNTLIPSYVSERYAQSRIVALSTGNVYPLVPVASRGSRESDPMDPVGEYGNACMARERLFDYYSQQNNTRMALIRLNYAVDLRYGVLVDIAQKVYAGEPIDVTNGHLNCIWQGDANDMIIRSLALVGAPARPLNLTYPQVFSVRSWAREIGALMDKQPVLIGEEANSAYLNNPEFICERLGIPLTPISTVLRWTARWIENNGRLLNKPTHFEVRDGKY